MSPRSSDSQASEIMQGVEFNDLADNRIPYDYEKRLSPGPMYLLSQQPTKPWKHESPTSSRILGHGFQCVELGGAKGEDICQKNPTHSAGFRPPLPDVHPGTPWHPPNNSSICEDWDFDQAFEFRNWPVKLTGTAYVDQNSTHFNPEDIHFGNLHDFGLDVEVQLDARPYSQPQDQNQTSNFLNNPMYQLFQPKDGSNHRLENIVSSSAHPSKSIKKIRSWFRPKSGDSSRASSKYADSHLTTETGDSGYFSGYASRISLEDIHNINPKSLEEFNELYRVACSTLHEPHSKSQWKDIPTCNYCSYSSIHNLAWSARYLKLEVFSLELQLKDVYDVCALDAAGNTALHYAAASGAGLKHIKALIDAGVNPYIANTAGELFVYCLRPLQPLIHLLELLQPQLAFDWRNNSGQTILHALALKMTDPGLRDAVFKLVAKSSKWISLC
jgi:ankyrin repeat protein